MPRSLTRCAEFLVSNPDYRTAQGKALLFACQNSEPYGELESLGVYWLKKEATEETGRERLERFAVNYWVPQLSVHRREEFLYDSQTYMHITDEEFSELLHCFTFICEGKSKFVDCLYLFRQAHEGQYTLPDTFQWLTGDNWLSSYRMFSDSLMESLARVDRISTDEALKIINRVFWSYLCFAFKEGVPITQTSPIDWLRNSPMTTAFLEKTKKLRYR